MIEYACGYQGRWHLGKPLLAQHGFTTWLSTEGSRRALPGATEGARSNDYIQHLIANGFEPDIQARGLTLFSALKRTTFPEEFQMASFLGAQAAKFIEEHAQRPFVLYVSCTELPHA